MRSARKLYIAVASLLVAVGAIVALNMTGAETQAVGNYRNYSSDAIISGGAITQAELLQKYDANVGDIKNIYTHYGITRDDIAGKTSVVKSGVVHQDGRVVVDGKTVATGAYSLSRKPFNDSRGNRPRTVTINGTKLYEGPNMSIFVRSVDAFVYMKDGRFHRAIISSCANPVVATPPPAPKPKPEYKCESLTARKIADRKYSFTVRASAKNAEIVSYNYDFGNGRTATTTLTTLEHTYAQPGTYTATVTVNVRVDGKIVKTPVGDCKVTIKIDEPPKPKPVYKCESLKISNKISRTEFEFTATAGASNATIVSYNYDFGDGNVRNDAGRTVRHTYAQPGNYTATVTVNVRVDGKVVKTPVGDCKVSVTVKEEPKAPVYKCDSLTAQLIQGRDRTYQYTLAYTAEGGATLNRVVYNFGDGNSETFTAANARNVEHTYAQPGNYTTTATLYFNVPSEGRAVERSVDCKVRIEVPKPKENCPIPGKEHLPKDHPDCKEAPVEEKEPCPVPGKEHLPKDSSECVETPPELPQTGIDTFISGGIGLGSITAAGYYWAGSRRNLLGALLNK